MTFANLTLSTLRHGRTGKTDKPLRVDHPVFARVWILIGGRAMGARRRAELLSGVSGDVVDIGVGSGSNFRHYPRGVSRVTAVEPEPRLRAHARREAGMMATPIAVLDGVAASLPLPDHSCDAAIVSLVLCSVPDQAAALAEVHRVLRPGGQLRFCEHVVAPDHGRARIQRLLDRSGAWPMIGAGCHLSRDTLTAITAAGFIIDEYRMFESGVWPLMLPHALGVAHRP